jgi:limonene-1,2-epoxide hydrolase
MTSRFRAAVESGTPDSIAAVLHPDVEFRSPAVFTPYVGREATITVLRAFMSVVSDFRYVAQYEAGDGEQVLQFTGRVGDREVSGIDIVRADADGLVTELTVMIRPLKALLAVVERMGVALG